MAIPESQLETWSHQGSITQSAATYNTVKRALEASTTAFANKNYKVFLQGSYGNDTNVYAESDVDVVIKLDDVYFSDVDSLTEEEKQAFNREFDPATYTYQQYRNDVFQALSDRFGADVSMGNKAIAVAASSNRRKADVIAAMQFRNYSRFNSTYNSSYAEGICFFTTTGERIVNYPQQHSANLTAKHGHTRQWLKPTVRLLKNLRTRLVSDGMLAEGVAPSYFLEGLLYNMPDGKFGRSYGDCFVNAINWIEREAERQNLVCANEQYYLLRKGVQNCWDPDNADRFISAAIRLWNEW